MHIHYLDTHVLMVKIVVVTTFQIDGEASMYTWSNGIIKVDKTFDITAMSSYCKTKLGIFEGFNFYLTLFSVCK